MKYKSNALSPFIRIRRPDPIYIPSSLSMLSGDRRKEGWMERWKDGLSGSFTREESNNIIAERLIVAGVLESYRCLFVRPSSRRHRASERAPTPLLTGYRLVALRRPLPSSRADVTGRALQLAVSLSSHRNRVAFNKRHHPAAVADAVVERRSSLAVDCRVVRSRIGRRTTTDVAALQGGRLRRRNRLRGIAWVRARRRRSRALGARAGAGERTCMTGRPSIGGQCSMTRGRYNCRGVSVCGGPDNGRREFSTSRDRSRTD